MTLLTAISFLLINCGNNRTASNETHISNNSTTEKKEKLANTAASTGDGIVGTWKLRLEVFDDNGNRVPDEAEMKKGYSNNYLLQLNADGTCRIQQVFTGRYEKTTENGRNMLKVYRKKVEGEEDQDPLPDIYQITSLKKDELVLQIIEAGEPSSFWFFKRIK
jgi:hypothetical protein